VQTGRNVQTLKDQGPSVRVAFRPDGKTLASKHDRHVVKLWDLLLDSGKKQRR
jgi:hypothetical protein